MTLQAALTAVDAEQVATELKRGEARELGLLNLVEPQFRHAPRTAARNLVKILGGVFDSTLPIITLRSGMPVAHARELVILRGADAALGGWAWHFGFAVGVLGGTVCALRDLGEGLEPLSAPTGVSSLAEMLEPMMFSAAVAATLRDEIEPLDHIREGLGLDDTQLAAIFGVKRQAVAQWRTHHIPMGRRSAVNDVLATVQLLERKLKPGQLPLLAASPVEALGGATLLQSLAADSAGTRAAYETAFDVAVSA